MKRPAPRIWILDDEPDVLAYLLAALEDEGYVARGFLHADTFLAAVAESLPPDLLCLDILLREESGLSLYKLVRQREAWRDTPVVIVSGYSRREEFVTGEFQRLMGDEGFPPPEGFVEKPVVLPELLALLAQLLHGHGAPLGAAPAEASP